MDGAAHLVSAGTLIVLGPERAFGWKAGRGKLLNCMWAGTATRELALHPTDTMAAVRVSAEMISDFESIHAQCRKEITSLDSFSPVALFGSQVLMETLALRAMRLPADSVDAKTRRLNLAHRWMAEHLDSHEPIARLCDYLAVAPATLHREFVLQTGLSPADFFHKLKMRTALDLLRNGLSIKETAATLGYRCFNDFSRAIHRYYGHPPSKLLQLPANCPVNGNPLTTVA
jgi:AraC-like DNA-binding protein